MTDSPVPDLAKLRAKMSAKFEADVLLRLGGPVHAADAKLIANLMLAHFDAITAPATALLELDFRKIGYGELRDEINKHARAFIRLACGGFPTLVNDALRIARYGAPTAQ